MNSYADTNDDQQPVMWLKGYPLYTAHFIVLVFVVSMIATTIVMAGSFGGVLSWAIFRSSEVLNGQVWRVLTYGLINEPSLVFAIHMLMFVRFGREVEKYFGRTIFLILYSSLYLLSPLIFTLLGRYWPVTLAGESGSFAIFIAFAALYPDAMLMFNILAKWAAVVLVGIFSLIYLANHNWVELISLWVTTAYAYGFVRYQQGRFTLPSFSFNQRKPKLRVLPDLQKDETISINLAKDDSMVEMDALLDKIARSGMSSLTAKERSKLAKAREELMQKKTERS